MAITTFVASQILTAAQMNAVQGNDFNQTVNTKTASYTLVAADKGTRIVMNVASANTVTVNTSLFSAGDTLMIQNIGAGVSTVTAGTATVSSAGPLAIPQNGSGLLYFTSAGVSIFYPSAVTAAASAVSAVDINRVNTVESTSSVTYVGLTTAQTITMTTGTKALVLISFNANPAVGVECYASVAVSGATTIAADDARGAVFQSTTSGGYIFSASNETPLTLTAGSNTFTMQFKTSGVTAAFKNRSMTVIAYS